jgi:hypothetical protein
MSFNLDSINQNEQVFMNQIKKDKTLKNSSQINYKNLKESINS